MKTLLLLRHAKSSWDDANLPDHDRSLNKRGREAAPKMGRWIRKRDLVPDVVLCSTARRARQTCELVAETWRQPVPTRLLADLYLCPAEKIVDVLHTLDDDPTRVLIIGHNPGLADFLAATVGYAEKFPTAALAWLDVDIPAWSDLRFDSPMTLKFLCRPKDLD
jgi:phosphohistidine phosphatase